MSSQQTGHFERKIHKTEVEVHATAHTIHQIKMSFQQDVNLSALKAGGGSGCPELSREGETLKRLQITVRIIW